MKVFLIAPIGFPVPAIKGGAVETLITDFIDENEIAQLLDINVITVYDEDAKREQNNYKKTNFMCMKVQKNIFYKIFKFLSQKIFKDKNVFWNKCFRKCKEMIYALKIKDFLKKSDFDFVITEGGNFFSYKNVYKYVPKEKSILHIHGVMVGNDFIEKKYGYFLGISNYVCNCLKENGMISEDRIKLLYNGVKIQNFNKELSMEEKINEKKKYGISPEEKVILFCGRTVHEKGVKELLLAYKKIYNKCNAKLLIVGNSNFANQVITEYDKELFELACDISDKVIFAGHIYNKDLYRIYNIADVVVFPHLCEEAFGLTVVEVMANKKPVIITNSGAMPEIVENTNSIIIEKNNKEKMIDDLSYFITKLLEDDELRNKMGESAEKKAQLYDTKIYYNNFVKILRELKQKNEDRNFNLS